MSLFDELNLDEDNICTSIIKDKWKNRYNCYTLPILWSDGTVTSLLEILTNNGYPDGYPIGINFYENKFMALKLLSSVKKKEEMAVIGSVSLYQDRLTEEGIPFLNEPNVTDLFLQTKALFLDSLAYQLQCEQRYAKISVNSFPEEYSFYTNGILKIGDFSLLSTFEVQRITTELVFLSMFDNDTVFELSEDISDCFPTKFGIEDNFNGRINTRNINLITKSLEIRSALPIRYCSEYNEGFTKPGDWYLPSIGEVLQIYRYIDNIASVELMLMSLNPDYNIYPIILKPWIWTSSFVNPENLYNSDKKKGVYAYSLNMLANTIRLIDLADSFSSFYKLTVLPVIDTNLI